jgi:WD40 repeat protein
MENDGIQESLEGCERGAEGNDMADQRACSGGAARLEYRRHFDIDTVVHPCCIEHLPKSLYAHHHHQTNSSFHDSLFVCGEYELNEENGSRVGFLKVYNSKDGNILSSKPFDSGILDIKVVDANIAMVTSTGQLYLLTMNDTYGLDEATSVCHEDEGFLLSVSAACGESPRKKLAVSTEKSTIMVYETGGSGLEKVHSIQNAHVLCGENVPAWTVNFDPYDANILLTGGDDNMARLWDTRTSVTTAALRTHEAGVTSACWSPYCDAVFALGSYDGMISFWDKRMLKRPVNKIETGKISKPTFCKRYNCFIGGGVWRIKWFNAPDGNNSFMVAACMHGGTNIYMVDRSDDTNISVAAPVIHMHKPLTQTAAHPSDVVAVSKGELSYGVDIIDIRKTNESTVSVQIASSSFYQNIISIWSVDF